MGALENGMRFFINRDPNLSDTCITYVVNYGSINERYVEGAHLLEHVVAQGGTDTKTAEDILTEIRYFKDFNAETTYDDYTAFYVLAGKREIGRAIEFLSNIVNCSMIPEPSVEREKRRVVCEVLERMDEIPCRVENIVFRAMFGSEAFGSFEERLDSVKRITAAHLRSEYNSFFVPENTIMVVNTGLKHTEILDIINNHAHIEGDERRLSRTMHRNGMLYLENHTENDILVEAEGINSSRIGIGIPLPGALRFNRPHDYVAIELLGKAISERIYERGLLSGLYIYSNDVSALIGRDSSSIIVQTSTNPNTEDIRDVKRFIVDQIRTVSDGDMNKREMDYYKRSLRREIKELGCDVYSNANYAVMASGNGKDHIDMVSDISIRYLRDFARGIDPDRLASVIFVPKKSTNIRSE